MSFTQLHTHSSASDGTSDPFALTQFAASLGFTSLALTDHNTLAGHAAFIQAAQAFHIQPILGVEVRVHASLGHGHTVVLSRSPDEYDKLSHLVRRKKQIKLGDLKGCGLVTSGCLGGVPAQLLLKNDWWSARDTLEEFRDTLGSSFVVEVQPTFGTILAWLLSLARELSIPAIVTNDVHYLGTSEQLPRNSPGMLMLSERQMRALCPFESYQHAIDTTAHIASTFGHGIAY